MAIVLKPNFRQWYPDNDDTPDNDPSAKLRDFSIYLNARTKEPTPIRNHAVVELLRRTPRWTHTGPEGGAA